MPIAKGRGRQIGDRQLASDKASVIAYDSSVQDGAVPNAGLTVLLGEGVTQGFAGYISSNQLAYKATSNDSAKTAEFIYLETGSAGDVVSASQINSAYYSLAAVTPLVPGDPMFLSTSGTLTQTEPTSGTWQYCGVATDTTTFIIQIDPPIFL